MNKPLPPHHQSRSRGGYVLIVVLIVCLGLVSLTLLFGHSMAMVYRGSETDVAGRQADRAIEGAVQYASYLMQNVTATGTSGTSNPASTGTSGYSTNYLLPTVATYQSEAVPVGDATFWFIGEPSQSGSSGVSSSGSNSNSNSVAPTFGLVDEASKLNINTATVAMLENLPNMTQNLAQAIVTWRTSGSNSSTTSTTSTTSSSSGNVKGGPFESVYELAQVVSQDGDDPSILYGNDTNLNHVMDASESEGGQFSPGLYEYVTVFSREPNTLIASGSARVNVTQASPALATLLTSTFGDTRGRELERSMRGATVHSVLEFYTRSGMTEAELDQITPYLTMNSGKFATGLINVNTASQAVLQCVPGISQQQATQIVSTRASQTAPSTNLAWVAQLIGNASAIQAGPYLTTQTYQVTADVAAVGPHGRGYRRTLFVIDGSTGTPQIVYRHNMASLGWALGPDELQLLGQQQRTTSQ